MNTRSDQADQRHSIRKGVEAPQKFIAPDAKEALLADLRVWFEKLTALSASIIDSPADEQAGVPTTLAAAWRSAAADLVALADHYSPSAESKPVAKSMDHIEQVIMGVFEKFGIQKRDPADLSQLGITKLKQQLDNLGALMDALDKQPGRVQWGKDFSAQVVAEAAAAGKPS